MIELPIVPRESSKDGIELGFRWLMVHLAQPDQALSCKPLLDRKAFWAPLQDGTLRLWGKESTAIQT